MCTNWSIWYSVANERWLKTCQFNVHIETTRSRNILKICAHFTHSIWESIAETTSDAAVGEKVSIQSDPLVIRQMIVLVYSTVSWTFMRWNIVSQSIRKLAKIHYARRWAQSWEQRSQDDYFACNWKQPITLFESVRSVARISPEIRVLKMPSFFLSSTDPRQGTGIACTGQRNKLIVQRLMPNRKYIVDLFGVHAKIGGMTFKLGSTTVLFNRTAPIELIEGRSEFGKLTRFDRKAVYIFRVWLNGESRAMKRNR